MAYPTRIQRSVRAGLATGVLAAAGLASGAVLAQQAGQTGVALEEIVITGSRIANPNATSSSPILAVTGDSLKTQGVVDTGDLVDYLPQQITTGADLSNSSNPLAQPGGVTTVNLRGLGPQRTLVLVDGRRLGVGDPNTGNPNPSADINQIPAALIERIDVVTGGASAVYGSDAIAGVVNFVMRRDFEGVQVDAQYSFNQHNQHNDYMQGLLDDAPTIPQPDSNITDGYSKAFNVLVGGNFADGKGNAVAYLSYLESDPTKLANRDFAACQLIADGSLCGGSSNSNRVISLTNGADLAVLGDTFVPWGTAGTSPPPLFNSNEYMYGLLHQGERKQAGVLTKYAFNDHVEAYADFMFTNDRAYTEIAPSGLFIGDVYFVHCNNTMLSDQQRTALGCTGAGPDETVDLFLGRRNIEGGPRQFLNEHENYRGVFGFKGDINEAWSYDAYGSYYYTTLYNTNGNYVSKAKGQSALDNCVDGASGCVPWDIWTEGGVTPEAADYISTYGVTNGVSTQQIVSGSVTGDLGAYGIKLPTASEGIGTAFGLERRVDSLAFLPDLVIGSGDLSGGSGEATTVDNSTNVNEAFVEVRVPLIQDRTGAQDLVFEAGYRYSDYALSGGTDTYKLGLQWQPINSLRLRASFNHAIRAPSLLELYSPQTVTQTSAVSTDPCSPTEGGTVAAAASLAECQRTGVTAAQYGDGLATNTITQCPANQCATVLGGNPLLEPESADTLSFRFYDHSGSFA